MSDVATNNVKQLAQRSYIANVLLVDNDSQQIRFILEILAGRGICANLANDSKTALGFLEKDDYDLVLIGTFAEAPSQKQNQRAGSTVQLEHSFKLLHDVRKNWPELPVVMIASDATETQEQDAQNQQRIVEATVRAVREGCCDFLIEPLSKEKIQCLLDTLLPNHSVSVAASADEGNRSLYTIVGKSTKLIQTVELAKRVAPTSVPVLISGESGTGKELISFLVHHNSKRAQRPYIKVNCAALSDSLLESELFGHEKGAFTGAYAQRKGRFEMAHSGTLLLDEITETPPRFQAKLLRILEQQDFERVGGNKNIKVDVRIISTTNKDLLQEVRQSQFRRDLYYRLSGVRLILSPLRKRIEDLPELVWHFVNLYAREAQRRITKLDPAMMDIFAKYTWPGNIRQLRNVVLTSLILGNGQTLSLADVSWLFDELQPLPQEQRSDYNSSCEAPARLNINDAQYDANEPGLGGVPLKQVEQQAILDTLRQTAGNQTKAAKALGISDRTLRDKVRRYRQQGCLQLSAGSK